LSFDKKVWKFMKKIPEGRISTYKIIANKIGTNAYRAVGNACRRNPNPPTIPCHRVVRSDGGVGGFAGETSGEPIKKKVMLLKKEGIEVKNGKIKNFKKVLHEF
jgi:methylated-DNA-[protein]-cysteine S-methyltransferase